MTEVEWMCGQLATRTSTSRAAEWITSRATHARTIVCSVGEFRIPVIEYIRTLPTLANTAFGSGHNTFRPDSSIVGGSDAGFVRVASDCVSSIHAFRLPLASRWLL